MIMIHKKDRPSIYEIQDEKNGRVVKTVYSKTKAMAALRELGPGYKIVVVAAAPDKLEGK